MLPPVPSRRAPPPASRSPGLRVGAALAASVFLALLLASCASAPSSRSIPAVASFRESDFAGRWYEIARIPIPVARDWVNTSDEYRPLGGGRYAVAYTGDYNPRPEGGFRSHGRITQRLRTPDPAKPGEMLASFLPLVWMPYRLVYLSGDLQSMLVTSGTLDYLWIMDRRQEPPEASYEALVAVARSMGFEISRLERVPQGRR